MCARQLPGEALATSGGSGSFAESAIAPAGTIAAKPIRVGHAEAAALPLDLDAVFDTVGGNTYARSFRTLKPGGRIVSMLEQPRQDSVKEFRVEAIAQLTRVTTERLSRLAELVDRGAVDARLKRTFPVEQAPAALEHLEKDSPQGKIVLVP